MELDEQKAVRCLVKQLTHLEQAIERAKNKWGDVTGITFDLEEAQREIEGLKKCLESIW